MAVYRFVRSARAGLITAQEYSSDGVDLDSIVEMLEDILRGADPKSILGLPDGRSARSTYYRDQRIACAVAFRHKEAGSVDAAVEQVSLELKLGFETVRDAYYRHKAHARKFVRLQELLEGGE